MNPPVPAPRLRILLGREIAIGPGKAELLRLIEEMGSISAAARGMGMSCSSGVDACRNNERRLSRTLVEAAIGGRGGGGAQVFGREALNRYRAMEEKAVNGETAEMDAFSVSSTRFRGSDE